MIRFDLAYTTHRLRPAGSYDSLFLYKSQELPVSALSVEIKKSIEEYMSGDFDPIRLLGIEIEKALPARNISESAFEPTVSTRTNPLPTPKVSGTADTVAAPRPAKAGDKMYPDTMSNLTPEVSSPEHKLAAHRVLANHHLHNYHYAMSQEGPAAAQPFAAKHFAHVMAAKDLESQGVKDTPEHHKDLYNHYHMKMQNRTSNPDPFKLEVPYYSATQAHVDHLNNMGMRHMTGETEMPEPSKKQPASPRSLYQGGKFVGLPKTHPSIAEPYARLAAQQNKLKLIQGGSPMSGGSKIGEDEKTRKSMDAISALFKAVNDIKKDYGYGGAKEQQELSKPAPVPQLPVLFPENRQERRIAKQKSSEKQKKVEQQFGVAEKSLRLMVDLYDLAS